MWICCPSQGMGCVFIIQFRCDSSLCKEEYNSTLIVLLKGNPLLSRGAQQVIIITPHTRYIINLSTVSGCLEGTGLTYYTHWGNSRHMDNTLS